MILISSQNKTNASLKVVNVKIRGSVVMATNVGVCIQIFSKEFVSWQSHIARYKAKPVMVFWRVAVLDSDVLDKEYVKVQSLSLQVTNQHYILHAMLLKIMFK